MLIKAFRVTLKKVHEPPSKNENPHNWCEVKEDSLWRLRNKLNQEKEETSNLKRCKSDLQKSEFSLKGEMENMRKKNSANVERLQDQIKKLKLDLLDSTNANDSLKKNIEDLNKVNFTFSRNHQ